jgi:hypothetical protein
VISPASIRSVFCVLRVLMWVHEHTAQDAAVLKVEVDATAAALAELEAALDDREAKLRDSWRLLQSKGVACAEGPHTNELLMLLHEVSVQPSLT